MARPLHSFITALALIALLIAPAYPAEAQSDTTIVAAHVSFDGGGIEIFEDSGAVDPIAATLNTPVLAGVQISTTTGRAEVQIDEATVLRMDPNSRVIVVSLAPSQRALRVDAGTIEVRAFSTPDLTIQTPSLTFVPQQMGTYRVDVSSSTTTAIVHQGRASVPLASGDLTILQGNMVTANTAVPNVIENIASATLDDDFDAWNDARDLALGTTATDKRVSPILAANALDTYGHWLNTQQYGMAWSPDEPPTWSPYTLGSWVMSSLYGPMWVSTEPWGWTPYHYGRWLLDPTYGWIWIPDQGVVSWAPALVLLAPVLIPRIGSPWGSSVGWGPLGPDQVYQPWYDTALPSNNAASNNAPGNKAAPPPFHSYVRPGVSPLPGLRFPEMQRSVVGAPAHYAPSVRMNGGASSSGASRSSGGGGSHVSSGGGGGGGHVSSGGGGSSGGGKK